MVQSMQSERHVSVFIKLNAGMMTSRERGYLWTSGLLNDFFQIFQIFQI